VTFLKTDVKKSRKRIALGDLWILACMFGNDRVVGSQINCWMHDACNFVAEMPIAKNNKTPHVPFLENFFMSCTGFDPSINRHGRATK
jgi:hypothetical protein